jgi:aspartate kinase
MLVQKYGGSSLASPEKIVRVSKRVRDSLADHEKMIVVVSAMGKSTDHLLGLAGMVSREPVLRERDVLLSTGEQVSAALLAMSLSERGVRACSMNAWQLGIMTDMNHGEARITHLDSTRIDRALQEYDVIVVTGFQGVNRNGDITTLGRGGSDTSAVALASCCGCRCEIYSDVAGVYSCDPALFPGSRKLDLICYDHMWSLSISGAEVLNPVAVETAWKEKVPLYCGASFSAERGTEVVETIPAGQHVSDVIGIATMRVDHKESRARPGLLRRVTVVGKNQEDPGLSEHVYSVLENRGIDYSGRGTFPYRTTVIVDEDKSELAVSVLAEELDLAV